MTDHAYWDAEYRDGNFKHWEFDYPSPELAGVVATNLLELRGRVFDVGCGGGRDAIFLAQCGFQVVIYLNLFIIIECRRFPRN
jgi:SAM-dependent methyltransferase